MTLDPKMPIASSDTHRPRSPRSLHAVVGAAATVIAAVITAAGTIVASTCHKRDELENRLGKTEARLAQRERELDDLKVTLQQPPVNTTTQANTQTRRDSSTHGVTTSSEPANAFQLPSAPIVTRDEAGFTVAFYGCLRSGGTVTCHMTMMNNKQERSVWLPDDGNVNDSRAFGNDGVELRAGDTLLGRHVGPKSWVSLPPGVPVRAWVKFYNVAPTVTMFRVFQFTFNTIGGDYHVDFPDVQIAA